MPKTSNNLLDVAASSSENRHVHLINYMNTNLILKAAAIAGGAFLSLSVQAGTILQPGDTMYAIDLDVGSAPSSNAGEEADKVIDGNSGTKYLSTGNNWSGFIVTPGASLVRSMRFTTANDAQGRDPAYYVLYGTYHTLNSTAQGTGLGELWTKISSGSLSLPATRLDSSTVVSFANNTAYTSYKLVFPATFGNSDLMQIADTQFYTDANGSGTPVLGASNPIIPVDATGNTGSSRNPTAENPAALLDDNPGTKYLNFGEVNSGFIVAPQSGPSTAIGLKLWTANDHADRDPAGFSLFGINGVVDPDSLNGTGEGAWTLIASGLLDLPTDRLAEGGMVWFDNDKSYEAYRFVATSVRDEAAANSMQISGFQLYSIPEPSTLGLVTLGGIMIGGMIRRRRH